MKLSRVLQKQWESLPEELSNARLASVTKSLSLGPEERLGARKRFLVHEAYDMLRESAPIEAAVQEPPEEPEATDPLYRVLAAPVAVDWIPMQEWRRIGTVLRASVDDLIPEPYLVPRQSAPWRKRKRLYRETRAATSPMEAVVEDEADGIDDLSSEDETVLGSRGGSGRRKGLVFPKEEEL